MSTESGFESLPQTRANYVPLSPISFLVRTARVHGRQPAVIHGARRRSYAQLLERCRRLASALARAGVAPGSTVAIMAPNIPELLEAHFAVPMSGAVLCALNTRLDPAAIAFILDHAAAGLLIFDREYAPTIRAALDLAAQRPVPVEMPVPVKLPVLVEIEDPAALSSGSLGGVEYEAFLAGGDPEFPIQLPGDEWQAIALNYTSGTTGDPKGVVLHHRGAYLNATGNALALRLGPQTRYLWTLPMFHCNGWTHTWAVTLAAGAHVCLRRVEAAAIFAAVADEGVTQMAAAPIVLGMLIHAPESARRRFTQHVAVATGGAAPPSPVIAAMEAMGFSVTHLYGLTESYGPACVCAPQPELDAMTLDDKALFMSRQGVNHPMLEDAAVLDPETLIPVPADGRTMGELMLRGNTVMKGYLRNPAATEAAFEGGWFHTGDLAVMHPDRYVEIKDRAKDVIISGGENISTLEVEEVLYQHPDVLEAAVVARPDPKWGETPQAFVLLRDGAEATGADLTAWCRSRLAHFKSPRHVTFGALPKTSTGKIQKFDLRARAREDADRHA